MIINNANLNSLYTGFSAAFSRGFKGVESEWAKIATEVPSTTGANEYGWLKEIPGFREWIGDRHINSIANDGYRLKNRRFEQTVGVKSTDIDDDNIGIYAPLFRQLGQNSAEFPDTLVFELLEGAFDTECYDGQNFFDSDHPVLDKDGAVVSVSNTGGGSGAAWYLLDVRHALKPLIYQSRKKFDQLVRKDQPTDDNVFFRDEYIYGSDGRGEVGFGFWQMAYGSKQTLNAENYAAARAALGTVTGDHGKKLGIKGTLLVVPQTLEGPARKILMNDLGSGGETNEWKGSADLHVSAWL